MDKIDQFKAKFVEESMDNIRDLEEALLLLENDMENQELIERIFRAMHSIKGGGAMFGFNRLSEFTHHLETIYDNVRNKKINVNSELITLTFSAIDRIMHLLKFGDNLSKNELSDFNSAIAGFESFLKGNASEKKTNIQTKNEELVNPEGEKSYLITFIPQAELLDNGTNPFLLLDDVHALGKAVTVAFTSKIPDIDNLKPDTCYTFWQIILSTAQSINEIKEVFIFVDGECELHIDQVADASIINSPKLKELLDKASTTNTLLTLNEVKNCVETPEEAAEKKKAAVAKEHKISSIRVSSHKVDELVTLVSELVITQSQLSLFAENNNDTTIAAIAENIQKLSRQLRDNAFDISLIPLQSELMRFQRLVRDLSKEQNKDIDFIIEGSDIELDKTIIENLTDPLLHILRNCIDHGIESKEERIAAGKSPKGTILFKAYNSGANVIIEVSDDGRGIDPDIIMNKAVKKGFIKPNTQLAKEEIFELLFTSGFSTRETVSDISGRGVGMDVVRRKIAGIRGDVSIDSEKGKGTIMSIRLPFTLSIIDGLLIKVAANHYVLPISSIETIFSAEKGRKDTSFNYVVTINNEQIPYIDLRDIFKEAERTDEEYSQMILIRTDDKKLGIIADSVVGEYQTVVKPLGRFLEKQGYVSGASIMGDGTISMVIDTSRLLNARRFKKETAREMIKNPVV
ncbi:MAG: chemotaxis protein CheA [Cytophagaceae bacterium]|nr:chemotaxis protein CheA [Cytophagaceae bacterium]